MNVSVEQYRGLNEGLDIYADATNGRDRKRIGTVYFKPETNEIRFSLGTWLVGELEAKYANVTLFDLEVSGADG